MITLKSLDSLVVCPYCQGFAELVGGRAIYGKRRPDLFERRFWLCRPCNAYVGCHKGTTKPFGTLANEELRAERQQTHALFDPLWVNDQAKKMKRTRAYKLLADKMGVAHEVCHIGHFSVEQCRQARELISGGAVAL